MPSYAIYAPPSPGLPHLAVVIENGLVIACEPVHSNIEARELLNEVEQVEPEFLAEAVRSRN